MSRLDANGVLNDYSIRAVMAFDEQRKRAPTLPRGIAKPLATDRLLEHIEAERERARQEREQSRLARLIRGYHRLP